MHAMELYIGAHKGIGMCASPSTRARRAASGLLHARALTLIVIATSIAILGVTCFTAGYHISRVGVGDGALQLTFRRPPCVVETCNDDWRATDGLSLLNQDDAGCARVRSMRRMSDFGRNATAHWCKALRALRACERGIYRYFIFRDDDTIIDVAAILQTLTKRKEASLLASYKLVNKRIVTNWFAFDTQDARICARMRQWWDMRQVAHPEHDQKFFNILFKCGKDGVSCVDKRVNRFGEVHCRSSLGNFRSKRRQE
eukprot:IDg2745t1